MNNMQASIRRTEQGWTLVTGLIFLIIMTLLGLTAMKFANTTTQVVGNVQSRNLTEAAAQLAVDTVVNSYYFVDNPTVPVPVANRCGGVANKVCVDTNSDGTNDIEVTIQQEDSSLANKVACLSFKKLKNVELDATKADDAGCLVSNSSPLGIISVNPDDPSACAAAVYDVRAEARDLVTGSTVVVHQGISVKADSNNETLCTAS